MDSYFIVLHDGTQGSKLGESRLGVLGLFGVPAQLQGALKGNHANQSQTEHRQGKAGTDGFFNGKSH